MIKRNWSPIEADEWTKEDWITIVLSAASYVMLTVGVALALLLQPLGYVLTVLGIIAVVLMHWIVDPKLKAISEEYEKKQQDYLKALEDSNRWKTQ